MILAISTQIIQIGKGYGLLIMFLTRSLNLYRSLLTAGRPLVRPLPFTCAIPPTTLLSRTISSPRKLSPQKIRYYNAFQREYGNEFKTLKLPTKVVLDGLRDLSSWRQLKIGMAKSVDYRDALQAIISYLGPDWEAKKPILEVGELEKIITPENTVTWRMIQNLIEDGVIPELEDLDDSWKAMIEFHKVQGFGRVKARQYVEEGARSLDDLLSAREGNAQKYKLSEPLTLAVRYHNQMSTMIPRSEVEEFDKLIKQALHLADPKISYQILGSYRRGESISAEIDVVVWHESFPRWNKNEPRVRKILSISLMGKIMDQFHRSRLLDQDKIFSSGLKQFSALTTLPTKADAIHRRLNLRICPLESLPFFLLMNTGDDRLITILRKKAGDMGYNLNELAMGLPVDDKTSSAVKDGTEFKVKDEAEIFAKLKLPYLEPSQRSFHKYQDIL
ncbi:hypothetical protein C361_03975 [Cryptococcus neoformans Tu259-1]|uniref:DNA polymerase n=1 Tax=Cryptococcus neoformans Tu259-1 TaxID=1230072 RepID=A0A854QHW4_CRYNE|nr:hypothetical protein C361_03975 [Cryptococcus neoformans var. grubii Tu259-1]OXG79792.1 hypothetical protein C350_03553 [Cryptococcus neoformans var. grubii MW-RSA36]OXL07932.1 hypothetical protein C348_03799 [Cryptococcus neoformans var. grubii Gb118]